MEHPGNPARQINRSAGEPSLYETRCGPAYLRHKPPPTAAARPANVLDFGQPQPESRAGRLHPLPIGRRHAVSARLRAQGSMPVR
jgi:hypothetical protein